MDWQCGGHQPSANASRLSTGSKRGTPDAGGPGANNERNFLASHCRVARALPREQRGWRREAERARSLGTNSHPRVVRGRWQVWRHRSHGNQELKQTPAAPGLCAGSARRFDLGKASHFSHRVCRSPDSLLQPRPGQRERGAVWGVRETKKHPQAAFFVSLPFLCPSFRWPFCARLTSLPSVKGGVGPSYSYKPKTDGASSSPAKPLALRSRKNCGCGW